MYKAYEIAPDIYWVGVLEWDETYIHGFQMDNGSTNNAYLILDEKITLIDTCSIGFVDELIARISDVIDPAKIDYIISNHSEKDHASSIGRMLELAPNATVVTSIKGKPILERYFGDGVDFQAVQTGDTLSIGKRTLSFVQTPFVHWPDNMVTYSGFDKILFSNDAFGQFYCTSKRFDDEVDPCLLIKEAKKYFANIVLPYSRQTLKALESLEGLEFSLIAPAHGAIWRSRIPEILELYKTWATLEPTNSAVVVYDSMYGATKRMAKSITEAFMAHGISVRQFDLHTHDQSDIIVYTMDAKYVAVGSSTLNMTMQPDAARFLGYLRGLCPKGRIGIAFGSYGWVNAGQDQIVKGLETAGYVVPKDPICFDWNDTPEDEQRLFEEISSLIEE